MPRVWTRLTFRYTVFYSINDMIQTQHRKTLHEIFELLQCDLSLPEYDNIRKWDAKTPMLGQFVQISGCFGRSQTAIVVRTK